jgi:hypothetical protein
MRRADLAPCADPLIRQESLAGAHIALIGRAGERREASLDAAVDQEVLELFDHGSLPSGSPRALPRKT